MSSFLGRGEGTCAVRIEGAVRIRGARTLAEPSGAGDVVFRGAWVAKGDLAGPAIDVDAEGDWLLPGWIDLQVNDLAWLAEGPHSPAEHAERIRDVVRYQAKRGVTGIVLATVAAPIDEVVAYLEGAAAVETRREPLDGAFLGVLVEGTFMNPAFSGAHNSDHVRPPDVALLDRLLATGGLRLLNVAPEASEEALDVIARASERGVIVGCGHAKPSGERVREAVRAGLRYVIHLGNGPTGTSLKGFAGGGLMEEALRNDDLVATVIADGVHLDRRIVRDIIARKEIERVAAVSDAGFAMGFPRGRFTAFGVRGEASPDGRSLRVLPREGAPEPNPFSSDAAVLFGSAVGMREVFENILNWLSVEMEGIHTRRHAALPFEDALLAACALTSRNPARLLGEAERGHLGPGARADALLVRIHGGPGEYRVEVRSVWVGGTRL